MNKPTKFNFYLLDVVNIALNIYLLFSSPLIGIASTSLLIYVKVSAYRREKDLSKRSAALIARLQNSEEFADSQRVMSLIASTHSMSVHELEAALEVMRLDFLGYVIPPICCDGCKYFYGKHKLLCALHPSGIETDVCSDFDNS